jgi:LacI family transcriptional regulator
LREAGLRVPQDISVTGHNDMPLVDMVDPPLTTIRLPHRELGWRAAEMLFDEIEGRALSASTVVLRPELVVRASTGPRRAQAV